MANKFVIEGFRFKMSGCVDNHSELVKVDSDCRGGGWWYMNPVSKIFLLYSKSFDYGRATREDILRAFKDHLFSYALEGYTVVHSKIDHLSYAMTCIEDDSDHTQVIGRIEDNSFIVREKFKNVISE